MKQVSKTIGRELDKIAKKVGGIDRLSKESVVQEAARQGKGKPLYNEFEWDDSVAGHIHRLRQAGELIRSFRIIIHPDTEVEAPVPVWIADPPGYSEGAGGYSRGVHIRSNREMAMAAINQACARAASAVTSARNVSLALNISDREFERMLREHGIARIK